MVEVRNYNAAGDGMTNDTAAVQQALDSGEVVHFSPGTYLCGTLYLRSNGGIHLAEGATLLAIPGKENYNADDFSSRNLIFSHEHTSGAHFIIAEDCANVSITGKGTISGNYLSVFDTSHVEAVFRPHYSYPPWRMAQMIFLVGCQNVKINGITMKDPQYWTCFLLDCEEVHIADIKLRADRRVLNADGLDIDCCRHVLIENCDIDCGDDCIAIRANETHAGRHAPCQDVVVRNCLLSSPACGVRIGVGNGKLKNTVLRDLKIKNSAIGIGLCPSYTREKCVEISDICIENIAFEGEQAFIITPEWGFLNMIEDAPAIKPLRNIIFRNFQAESTKGSLLIFPVKKELYSGISLENVHIHLKEPSSPFLPHRWAHKEYGVLNILRGSELDLEGFTGTAAGDHPIVLHSC